MLQINLIKITKKIVLYTSLTASLTILSALSAFAAPKYTIKMAYENNPGEPFDLAVHEWARLFSEKTNGEGLIMTYPSSQLGSKKDIIEQMQMGMGVATLADGAFFADYIPDFGIMMGPYLGRDYKDVIQISETPWFKGLSSELDKKGLHILAANWLYGSRHLMAKKAVYTPADLKGLKIRVPNARIQIEAFKQMGAAPTPMPLAEVYTALSTGIIDGAENPVSVLYGQKTFEPAPFLMLTGHLDNVTNITISQKYFAKLPPEIQTALTETALVAGDFMTKLGLEQEQKDIEKMKAAGVTVIEVDRALFRKASEQTYTQFPEWSKDLYQTVQDFIK